MNIRFIYSLLFFYFRTKRLRKLYDYFLINTSTSLLDVGGSLYWWQLAEKLHLPIPKVTIVNLKPFPEKLPPNVTWIVGDGTKLPFADRSFDLVFSNSVIEHLGTWTTQVRFASEIARVGANYYVQTPNKGFIVEPHLITPFIHWLPSEIQRKVLRNLTLWGLITRPTDLQCEHLLKEIRLLTHGEMVKLFPKAELVPEKFMGLTKSLIALHRS